MPDKIDDRQEDQARRNEINKPPIATLAETPITHVHVRLGHSGDWREASKRLDKPGNRSSQATESPLMAATTSDRPTFQQNAVSATLLLVVPLGVFTLWLQDRWTAFKAWF